MWISLWLAACTAPEAPLDGSLPDAPAPTDLSVTAPATLALLADPHVTDDGERADRLRDAVAWVAARDDVDAVVVLGDVAWGDGPAIAHAALSDLPQPWVAFTGDNEIATGAERTSWDTFMGTPPGPPVTAFVRADAPVLLEEPAQDAWLQNLAFTVGGVRVICLDWSSRLLHPLLGEIAWLHDVVGGTLPFFADQLGAAEGDVVLLSHHPMLQMPGTFTVQDWTQVEAAAGGNAGKVVVSVAGHLHADADADSGLWPVHVLDAVWDDDNVVGLLRLDGASGYTFRREIVPAGAAGG